MKLKIKRIIKTSLIDWEGKIVSTLYVPYCNFRCPFCYNYDLILNSESLNDISFEKINDYLYKQKDFIDGICMSGGEPTLYPDLPEYFRSLKDNGFLVKLDTNGTNPYMLKEIIESNLIDYIAMDIKSDLNIFNYSRASGVEITDLLDRVKQSIAIIMQSNVDYEFRTTVVPSLHEEKTIINIAKHISGAKKYILQNFSPQDKMLDSSYSSIIPYPENVLKKFLRKIDKEIIKSSYR